MNNFLPQKRGMQVVWIIVGCLIYAVGLNVFIIPMNLYSGGSSRSCTAVKLWSRTDRD